MNSDVKTALIAAAVTLIVAFVSQRGQRRSQDANSAIQGKAVDLSVLEASMADQGRQLTELKASNAEMKERLKAVEDELETEREARVIAMDRAEAAEDRARKAEERADNAERRASRLEARVTQLEDALRANDITIPPVP